MLGRDNPGTSFHVLLLFTLLLQRTLLPSEEWKRLMQARSTPDRGDSTRRLAKCAAS
jgi:hypothetical protein